MNFTSRGVRTAARSLLRPPGRQPRRYASHGENHGHGHGGNGESALHVAGGSGSESFGKSFYYVLAGIPVTYLTYVLATSEGDNFIGRYVDQFLAKGQVESDKLSNNETMLEQAQADRSLFKVAQRDTTGPELRFPEMFNVGSPMNVAAGEATIDLEELARYYKEKHEIMEENRRAKFKDGKITTIYDRPDTTEAAAKVLRSAK